MPSYLSQYRKLESTSYVSFAGALDTVRDLCEPEIAAKIKPVWGVDDECEMNGVWRDCGVENLWITFGTPLVSFPFAS